MFLPLVIPTGAPKLLFVNEYSPKNNFHPCVGTLFYDLSPQILIFDKLSREILDSGKILSFYFHATLIS